MDHQHHDQHRSRYHEGCAAIDVQIDACGIKQTKCRKHRNLVCADTLTFAYDVLTLLIHHRLNAVTGCLAGVLRGIFINHHVGLNDSIKHDRNNTIGQFTIHAVLADSIDVVDGRGHLTFTDGGVEGIFHGGTHLSHHRLEGLIGGTHQHACLVRRQADTHYQRLRIGDFLGGVGAQGGQHGCFRRIAQILSILLHQGQLSQQVIQRHQHVLGDTFRQVIGGLYRSSSSLAMLLSGDGILHILGGGDRLVRDVTHLQAVAIRHAGQREQTKQDHAAQQDHSGALGTRAMEPGDQSTQAAALATLFFLPFHCYSSPLRRWISIRRHQAFGACLLVK